MRPKKAKKSKVFFVLHYDEDASTIRIVPMEAGGVLSGKRAGRPRFQCVMDQGDKNIKTVPAKGYDIVDAHMVMKTPIVKDEAWDVPDVPI